jgi:hypothetical protein
LALLAQTAAQPITSGWNYFPLNPSIATTSGAQYELGMMANINSWPAASIAYTDLGAAGYSAIMSGTPFANGFVDPFASLFGAYISGYALDVVMVTA